MTRKHRMKSILVLAICVSQLPAVARAASLCDGVFASAVEAPESLRLLAMGRGKRLIHTAIGWAIVSIPTLALAGGSWGGNSGGGASEFHLASAQIALSSTLRALSRNSEFSAAERAALERLSARVENPAELHFVDPLDNTHLFGTDLANAPLLVGGEPGMPLLVNSRAINDPSRFDAGVLSHGQATALLVEALGRGEPALGAQARERLADLAQSDVSIVPEPFGRAQLELLAPQGGSAQVSVTLQHGEFAQTLDITPHLRETFQARTGEPAVNFGYLSLRDIKWVPAFNGVLSFRAEFSAAENGTSTRSWQGGVIVRIDGETVTVQLERLKLSN